MFEKLKTNLNNQDIKIIKPQIVTSPEEAFE
jgi:hypothetical protein